MKKEFMEPEMKRIELNLKESIADGSNITQGEVAPGVSTQVNGPGSCYEYFMTSQIPVPSVGSQDYYRAIYENYDILDGVCLNLSREAIQANLL